MNFFKSLIIVCCLTVVVSATNETTLAKGLKNDVRKVAPVQIYKSKIIKLANQQQPMFHKLVKDVEPVESFRNLMASMPTASKMTKYEQKMAAPALDSINRLKKLDAQFGTISPVPPSLKTANTLFKRYAFRDALYLSSLRAWLLYGKRSDYTNAMRYLDESQVLFENAVEELSINS